MNLVYIRENAAQLDEGSSTAVCTCSHQHTADDAAQTSFCRDVTSSHSLVSYLCLSTRATLQPEGTAKYNQFDMITADPLAAVISSGYSCFYYWSHQFIHRRCDF